MFVKSVIPTHHSFVTTTPHLRGRVEDSQAKVLGNYFLIVPTEPVSETFCYVGRVVLRAGLLPPACPHREGLIPGL